MADCKYLLAIENRNYGYIPVDFGLLANYGGECTNTLQGIDKYTANLTPGLLREYIIAANILSPEETEGEFVIISIQKGRYVKDKIGPLFNVPDDSYDEDLLFLNANQLKLPDENLTRAIESYSRVIDIQQLRNMIESKINHGMIYRETIQKLSYYEKRILVSIFRSYFARRTLITEAMREKGREKVKNQTTFGTIINGLALIFKRNKKDSKK